MPKLSRNPRCRINECTAPKASWVQNCTASTENKPPAAVVQTSKDLRRKLPSHNAGIHLLILQSLTQPALSFLQYFMCNASVQPSCFMKLLLPWHDLGGGQTWVCVQTPSHECLGYTQIYPDISDISRLYSDMRIPSGCARYPWRNRSPGWSGGTGDSEQAHIGTPVLCHSIFLIPAGCKIHKLLLEVSYIISSIILCTIN